MLGSFNPFAAQYMYHSRSTLQWKIISQFTPDAKLHSTEVQVQAHKYVHMTNDNMGN